MRYRKCVADLTAEDKQLLTQALLDLKAISDDQGQVGYNRYIRLHREAMAQNKNHNGYYVDAAHMSPAFLPWHREFLRQLEDDLRALKPEYANLTIPYWDWMTDDGSQTVFTDDLVGPFNAMPPYDVQFGPFGAQKNQWKCVDWQASTHSFVGLGYLKRGADLGPLPLMSTAVDVMANFPLYDEPPYDWTVKNSFRWALENRLHSVVHVAVGGMMEDVQISPNDPVFFLHHANVDRLWANWQAANPGASYVPVDPDPELPTGEGLNDPLYGLGGATPKSVWNTKDLGIGYVRRSGFASTIVGNRQVIGSDTYPQSPGTSDVSVGSWPSEAYAMLVASQGFGFTWYGEVTDHEIEILGSTLPGAANNYPATTVKYLSAYQDKDPNRPYQSTVYAADFYLKHLD